MQKLDIKQNISKAVEDGGYIDPRRIGKANSQLEYQPNHITFNGQGQNENQDDPSESEEYKLMIQKQRDIDYKSDRLVSSSMKIYKEYTQNQFQNAEQKVRDIRQKNKKLVEERRSTNSGQIDLIVVDKDLKKKNFIFGDRNIKEGTLQFINPRIIMKDDSEAAPINAIDNSKRHSTNNLPQASEQNQQTQTQTEVQDKYKFDFHQLKNKAQSKKKDPYTNKQIGNLPRDIQQISEIDDTQFQQGMLNDKFERSKVDIVQGDLVESFSMAYVFPKNNIQKTTHNLYFFRDLAPISRFLVKYTNQHLTSEQRMQNKLNEEFSNSELIQADEIGFDINNLQYNNLADIVSGRIGDETLSKYDNSVATIEDLPPQIQKKVEELIQSQLENQLKNLQLSAQFQNNNQIQVEPEQKKRQQVQSSQSESQSSFPSKEQIKNSFKQKSSQDQQVQIDQPLNMSSLSPKNVMGVSKNSEMTPEQKRMHQQIMTLHNQTDQILNKIGEIKSKKEDLKYIRDPQEHLQKYKEMKKELKQALNGLLYMILKTETNQNPQINNSYSELETYFSQLLENIDKIQGTKTTDGHLKTALLLTFLEEYQWIKQEDQLHKMDFDSTTTKQPQNKPNTFPNFLHNGQPQKRSNNTSSNPSPLTSHRQQESGNYLMSFNQNNNSYNNLNTSYTQTNKKNAKPSSSSGKFSAKENIQNQQVYNQRKDNVQKNNNLSPFQQRSNMNQRANTSQSPFQYKYGEVGAVDTTTSFYQQTPAKQLNNSMNKTDRSFTPNSTNKSRGAFNQSINKSQSALSNNRSVSPMNPNKSNANNNLNKSINSISQQSIQRQNLAPSRSKSPIISKKGISYENRNESRSPTPLKQGGLQQMKIPGIKKGQISQLNKSYIGKDTSFNYEDQRPNTYRK